MELDVPAGECVGVYACGPTVYNELHLGNARPLVAFDIVTRHLRARGYTVKYVRNITDVDDKIIRRAAELGETPTELTTRYTAAFHAACAELCCIAPDVEPRVTDHIGEIVEMIAKLVERGLAYASEGDVYFAVQQFDSYGALSHQRIDELESGARVDPNEKKRHPLDFALWKGAKPGEPFWSSPWGDGRPGWHIECSAMAWRHLGERFAIHGGGIDLAFPHHENERAQSQGALGPGTFARWWMHNGFVNFAGGKISKSDEASRILFERAFKLPVLFERHGGETARAFLLTTQYRNPINFEVTVDGDDERTAPLRFPGLEEAERRLEYGYLTLTRLADVLAVGKPGGAGAVAPELEALGWLGKLQAALDDDFNSAEALAALNEGLTLANRVLDGHLTAAKDVKRRTLERLSDELKVAAGELGLFEAPPAEWLAAHRIRRCRARGIDADFVVQRIAARTEARTRKAFAEADQVRDELRARGVEIMDTPRGTEWRVTE